MLRKGRVMFDSVTVIGATGISVASTNTVGQTVTAGAPICELKD